MELDINGTHQLLSCAVDLNLTSDDIRIERNSDMNKGIDFTVNIGKTKYIELKCHWGMMIN